ncbi:MAG: hypothetical protein KBD44_02850 [Candidatus Pacebacteria bacterium]|mgnify:CR=1 FL=1|jgi:hypothetical protein|nr:hypothetical protein [Candidatus Paceibacterota bacterium]
MTPKFESGSSATQDLQIEDLRHFVQEGKFLEAKSWITQKIGYLEGVNRELPATEAEANDVPLADWQKLRSDVFNELDHWKKELEVIEKIIKTRK